MYENYAKIRDLLGYSDYRVSKEAKIPASTFSEWKHGKYRPKSDKLEKIADLFNVSVEYLTTGKAEEKKSETGTKYYFDDESAQYAEFLHKNPDYKVLFDASRHVKPEDIDFIAKLIERTSSHD